MKIKNILNFAIGVFIILFASCDPIENREILTNSFNPNKIELEVVQTGNKGNGITLKMKTPGIVGYWDYKINKKFTDRVNFIYPIPGKTTFVYHVTSTYIDGELTKLKREISKEIEVQINELDQPLPPVYAALVGDQLKSKTWVFNGTMNDNKLWWYMCPPNDPSGYQGAWWNAGGTGNHPSDFEGKMVFDLNGGANYTYYADKTSAAVTGGGFAFNADFTKIVITGTKKILGNQEPRGNATGEYTIIKLTSTELILYVPTNGGGTGWTWVFKPM